MMIKIVPIILLKRSVEIILSKYIFNTQLEYFFLLY